MNDRHESTLRRLDAATGIVDEAQRRRASTDLEGILATPLIATPARRRRPVRRLAAVGAFGAIAITAGALALQSPGDSGVAYASWTSVPLPVAPSDVAAVVGACRQQLDDSTTPIALAERRGDFVAVLFYEGNPERSESCIAVNPPGSTQVEQVKSGVGGSSGPAWTPPAGRISEGSSSQYGGDHPAAFTEGGIGPGVVGVTIHAGARTIIATVENGRYAAWWPGTAFKDSPVRPSGEGGPELSLTYDVHLADGTIRKDAAPARPR